LSNAPFDVILADDMIKNLETFAFAISCLPFISSCAGRVVDPFAMEDAHGTLNVQTGPLGFSFADSTGETILSTAPGEDGASFFSFGTYDSLKDYHFYDPRDTQAAPNAARWKFAGDVAGKEEIPDGWRLTVEVEPEVGKELRLDVTAEEDAGFKLTAAIIEPAPVAFFRLTLASSPEEHFYGLGERFDRTDAMGGAYEMFTDISGELSSGINEVHVPVPFFVSGRGYGLFFEDPHPSNFDMNSAGDGIVRVTFSVRETLTWHLITGRDPVQVAARYGKLTGPAALPPVWAFAPMQWRNELPDGAALLDDALALRENDIPTSTLWIDNPWQTAYNTFTFNEDQFPDAGTMLRQVGDMGYKLLCWSTPYLDTSDDSSVREGMWTDTGGLFEEADAAGYFVKDVYDQTLIMPWKGGFPAGRIDFTSPEAVGFWQGLIERVTSMGIAGFKLDYGEEIVPGFLGAAPGFHFSDGSDGQTMHKLYSVLYHKTYRDKCIAGAGESFIIGRSSTYGGQKNVEAIWPGDLDNDFLRHGEPDPDEGGAGAVGGLPSAICALQNLSVSGFPSFGSDTGGYRGGMPTKEVLVRWAEHTALTPIMQLGGAGDSHNPWDLTAYDRETLDIYRKYARLHTRLFPLFYTLSKKATDEGTPPILPLGMFDPADGEDADAWDEYVVGESLLVAPVHEEGASARDVRFPAGVWIDWWSGEAVEGRSTRQVQAPLDTLPLFIARGSIIPMLKDDIDTFAPTTDPDYVTLDQRRDLLYLRIAPSGESSLALFEGTEAGCTDDPSGVTVDIAPGEWFQRFIVEVDWKNRGSAPAGPPRDVTKDGASLELSGDYALVYDAGCSGCWAWDGDAGLALVSAPGGGSIVISE
jgi:alpha-D-xyloside xylohydrolase